jgi:hypothetical protein
MKNDFSKFTCFVRGVIESGVVIQHSGRVLRNEAKMHFNRIMHHTQEFEKYLHQGLGKEMAKAEDEINSAIVGMVWQLYDLPPEERDRFIEYLNNFDPDGDAFNNK